jgi:predicted dienelactone hydrolase
MDAIRTMHKSTLICSAALLALAFLAGPGCSSGPAPAPAEAVSTAPPAAAELARSGLAVVAETEVTLGESTGTAVAVHVTYPQGQDPSPVVVFSHGAGGSGPGYQPLFRFWATHGYTVLAPAHADSAGMRGRDHTLDAREPSADASTNPKTWEARVRDLTTVIAGAAEIEASVAALRGRLDVRRLGVGGHSLGAFTAQLLAGAAVNVPHGKKGKTFADPRPSAFLLLSPQGRGPQGLTAQSWESVSRPLMVITGSRDRGPRGQPPTWRLDPFRLSPPGDKYAVVIEGASHLSFTGRAAEPGASPARRKGAASADEEVAIFRDLKVASLAFWDAFLRDDSAAKAFLESDALAKETGGKAKIERR